MPKYRSTGVHKEYRQCQRMEEKVRRMQRLGLVKIYESDITIPSGQKLSTRQQVIQNCELIQTMVSRRYEMPFNKNSEDDYYNIGQCLSYHYGQIWEILKLPARFTEFRWRSVTAFLEYEPTPKEKYEPLIVAVLRFILRESTFELSENLLMLEELHLTPEVRLAPLSGLWFQILNRSGRRMSTRIFSNADLYNSENLSNALLLFADSRQVKCQLLNSLFKAVKAVDMRDLLHIVENGSILSNIYNTLDLGLFCHHRHCGGITEQLLSDLVELLRHEQTWNTLMNISPADLKKQLMNIKNKITDTRNKIANIEIRIANYSTSDYSDDEEQSADTLSRELVKDRGYLRKIMSERQILEEKVTVALWHQRCQRAAYRMANELLRDIQQLIKSAQTTPLSLKQLSRLVVRSTMTNVDIVQDCYKLPVDKELQDYICVRSIKAPISRFYVGDESRYDDYCARDVVMCRYSEREEASNRNYVPVKN